MATRSSILAWETPWTEKPGRLHSPWGRKEPDMTERLNVAQLFTVVSLDPLHFCGISCNIFPS